MLLVTMTCVSVADKVTEIDGGEWGTWKLSLDYVAVYEKWDLCFVQYK